MGYTSMNYTRLRIYTENKKLPELRMELSKYFPSYTVYEANGVWRNVSEPSVVFEVVSEIRVARLLDDARKFITYVKELNNQETVLLTYEAVQGELC